MPMVADGACCSHPSTTLAYASLLIHLQPRDGSTSPRRMWIARSYGHGSGLGVDMYMSYSSLRTAIVWLFFLRHRGQIVAMGVLDDMRARRSGTFMW